MAVTVPLTSDEQAALSAQAEARGVSLDFLLRQAVLRIIYAPLEIMPEGLSAMQWEKEFDAWLDSLPTLTSLSDEGISRESIYTREDEWR
jgi:hypothetical protein